MSYMGRRGRGPAFAQKLWARHARARKEDDYETTKQIFAKVNDCDGVQYTERNPVVGVTIDVPELVLGMQISEGARSARLKCRHMPCIRKRHAQNITDSH